MRSGWQEEGAGTKHQGTREASPPPLLKAIASDAGVEAIENLLLQHPEVAGTADKDGMLPLHHAALRRAGLETIQALLVQHPESAERVDGYGKRLLDHPAADHLHLCDEDPGKLQAIKAQVHACPEMSSKIRVEVEKHQ